MRAIPGILLTILVVPATATSSELQERFEARVESVREEMIEVRRDLHRHPEVSGEEKRTSGIVAERLRGLGFSVTRGVGGYGVVAILEGGEPGPMAAFRADMDAVYSSAPDPVSFSSENEGVRHICGHDMHTTIGLTLAEGLASVREDLPGSVMFVFQPAEENATGARAMIADGALEDPRPDAIFAFHTAPMPVGQLITSTGTLMAWRDRVRVTVRGKGDLESRAREIGAAIDGLGTIPPDQAGVPTTGDFLFVQSGAPSRDASGSWSVGASISTATHELSDSARRQIAEYLDTTASEGVKTELDYQKKWVAGVTNDRALAEAAIGSARSVLGDTSVATTRIVIPVFSEDFGSFQEVVPGVMLFLGVSNPEKGWVGMPHSPDYVADEEAIFVGARSMGAILLDFLVGKDGAR